MKFYSEFTGIYVQAICNALNEAGISMIHGKHKAFAPKQIESLTDFLQIHVRKNYDFLEGKGLVNKGKCPYTGEYIGSTAPYYWKNIILRRYPKDSNKDFINLSEGQEIIYLSKEGKEIMKMEENESDKIYLDPEKAKKGEPKDLIIQISVGTLLVGTFYLISSIFSLNMNITEWNVFSWAIFCILTIWIARNFLKRFKFTI